jgi:hypothetical protein
MPRRVKQIIYATFFFLFWFAIFFFGYRFFIKQAPSCFDGIQNQGEADVDCGGPCAAVCIPRGIRPLELVDQVLTINPDRSHLSFLAHVSNPNLTFAGRSFSYHFSLYDANDQLVQSYPGTSFIYGGEIKYILMPNVVAPTVPFGKVDFGIDGRPDWVSSDLFRKSSQLITSGIRPQLSGNVITVDGQVTNNDTITFSHLTVLAVFKGNLGQPDGASETELENLAPNTSLPFSIIHPNIVNVNLSATQVFVYGEKP